MRCFDCFSDRELDQIALQMPDLVALPLMFANLDDFRQRCHSDTALLRVENLTIRFRFLSSTASACCRLSQLVSVRIHRFYLFTCAIFY